MLFPKAKKIAREQNWYKTNDSVFGLYKGYFFTVGDASLISSPQFKYVRATTDNLTEEQTKTIKAELESNKKALKFSNLELGDNFIYVQFLEGFRYTKIKTVYKLLDFLVELFKKIGLQQMEKCHECGKTDNIDFYELNDLGTILCKSCFRETDKKLRDIEEKRLLEEKNYLIGFLGSVVFSIPGIIVWVLIAVYLNRMLSAIAMAIAILGIIGYDYFNGKLDKFTRYIIILSNIICILIANYVTAGFLLHQEGLDFNSIIQAFQMDENVQDFVYKNIMISFTLAFLIWVWLLTSLKGKKTQIRLAEKIEK